ncbi:MAG: hypothetical protein V3U82_07135 [Robiginitomaculum sp.]
MFYVVTLLLSPLILLLGDYEYSRAEILFGLGIYAVFLPFLFLNHRWAIIVLCLLYLFDKIAMIIQNPIAAISSILFGALVVSWSYKTFKVATELKRINSGEAVNPDVFD